MPEALSTKGGGCTGQPDVCKVPASPSPIPTPFVNKAMVANADKTSSKVLFENKEAVVETSEIANSTGDQAGSAGGVVSGKVGDKVLFKMGSQKVFAEGKGVVSVSLPTVHNGTNPNAIGIVDQKSQDKVLLPMG